MDKCKQDIVKYARLSYERGLVSAAGGNVSMRYQDKIIITGSGVSLRDVTVFDLLVADLSGKVLEGRVGLKPSKETSLHLKIYNVRADVDSIIHVHPPYATGYSVKGLKVPIITASAKMKLIDVPLVKYANPGSDELANNVEECVKNAPSYIKAIVLESHGIIAYDRDMVNCFDIADLVEDTARIAFIADNLPGAGMGSTSRG